MSLQGNATANELRGRINALDTLCIDAYDIAVKNGFEGTEEEWLASLKGDKGDKGDRGEKGETGSAGYTPVRGTDYWTEADKQVVVQEIKDATDGAVLYTKQSLNEEQKAQARRNIGVEDDGVQEITLSAEDFESGTAYIVGDQIMIIADGAVVRTKLYEYTELKKGDKIYTTNGVDFRIIYKTDIGAAVNKGFTAVGYVTEYVMPINAPCLFAIKYTDGHALTDGDLEKLVNSVKIERATEIKEKPTLNNEAKGLFAVMTYNVGGWYNGSSSRVPDDKYEQFLELQQGIIDRYKPDILCLQEYNDHISSTKGAIDNILGSCYYSIAKAYESTPYDGKAICTSRSMENAVNVPFTTTEGALIRNYEKAYVYMNGRKVCVISAHCGLNYDVIVSNVDDLINEIISDDEEYVILCMDSNVDHTDTSAQLYTETIQRFKTIGCKLANGGEHGVFKTYASSNIAIDNIITRGNINIKSVVMDTQKEGLSDGTDHYPLIAYVEVF